MASLVPPTQSQLERIYAELRVTAASLQRDVAHLQDWVCKQPHLPSPVDERRLRYTILYSKGSLEDAKRKLDLYYSMRGAVPELLTERDPLRPELQQCAAVMCLAPLPRLTDEGFRINTFRLMDADPDRFHVESYIKWAFMVGDVRMMEDVVLQNVFLVDLEGVTLKHLVKFTLPLMRKYVVCGQSVFISRLKHVHVVNAPSFVEKIVALFRPFLKEKLLRRIDVHPKGYSRLLECFPQEVLPQDYGGTLPPLRHINDAWTAVMVSYRDWFLREEDVRADESRRPRESPGLVASELFGPDGSFRRLELD